MKLKEQKLLIKKTFPDLTAFQIRHAYCIQCHGNVERAGYILFQDPVLTEREGVQPYQFQVMIAGHYSAKYL